MNQTHFTAVVIWREFSTGTIFGLKYRNIKNSPAALRRFEVFASRIDRPGGEVIHINYYFRDTRQFSHRTRFDPRPA